MELEQMTKQLIWLDEERRKDKQLISNLEERINSLENKLPPLERQEKDIEAQVTRLGSIISRIDEFEEFLLQLRIETKQLVEDHSKQEKKREEELEKARRTEIRTLEANSTEMRKELEQLPEIKRNLKNRVEEELRLSRAIDEVRNHMETVRRSEEEYTRTIRVVEDGRRQDLKRITDLTGELSAVRKRSEENSGKLELASATIKKIETRLNEILAVESERREAVSNFLDSQSLRDVERERQWKEWQSRFEQVETQAKEIESSLQALDATQRAVKRSQQMVDEITQKLERRITEITEVQRLTEERFRQEWTTFKADDQKRWTNYILTMEEQRGESQRQHEKLVEKVTHIEDEIQEIQDLLQQVNEHTEKRLQSLLSSYA